MITPGKGTKLQLQGVNMAWGGCEKLMHRSLRGGGRDYIACANPSSPPSSSP